MRFSYRTSMNTVENTSSPLIRWIRPGLAGLDRWRRRPGGGGVVLGATKKAPGSEPMQCASASSGSRRRTSVHEQAVVTGDRVPTAVDGRIGIPDGRLDVVDLFVTPVHLDHGISMHVIAEWGDSIIANGSIASPELGRRLAERRRACEGPGNVS